MTSSEAVRLRAASRHHFNYEVLEGIIRLEL